MTMDLIRLTYLSQTVQNGFATYRCKRKVAVTGQILCSRCGLLNRCYVSGRVCRTDRFARIEILLWAVCIDDNNCTFRIGAVGINIVYPPMNYMY